MEASMDFRCQQFTPNKISNNMLDIIDYKRNLFGKKVLENSCGQGHILKIVVSRYIIDAKKSGYSNEEVKRGLESDIYGAEIKKDTYKVCIENLNNVAKEYDIYDVEWKVFNRDILREKINIKFDYVVGNPPYISYKNLKEKERLFIKENFETCKYGKPDYCYAFIENAINYLKDNGKMVYLIPNSIFKNVFAKNLREFILKHLIKVFDYPNQKLFENALTSSAIMLLKKNSNKTIFEYRNITDNVVQFINKNSLNDKWIFENNVAKVDIEDICFGDYFKAAITIATQRNDVFVVDPNKQKELGLEKALMRPAISPRNKKYGKQEYIIFPYKFENDNIVKFFEKDFKNKYPNIYKYLLENKEKLISRSSDEKSQWFEYGRSQAIQNMNKKKLLISTVVTNRVNVYELKEEEIPYSGIYIIANRGYNLEIAKNILESKKFYEYALKIGTPVSGKSIRITASDINEFRISKEEYNL